MKNIAILGARGFIGKNTVQYLKNTKRYHVIPITRESINLTDNEKVHNFFKDNKIDIVIHCANQGGTRKNINESQDIIGNNLKMFFNIERCINKNMKFINFGSGAQYNKSRDLAKIKETEFESRIPTDDYGYSKYVMSKYIRSQKDKTILNPIIFGLYGIGEDYTYKFISNAIIKNILNMPIIINQNVLFDYLFIEDYYKILDSMIEDEWENCEFNLTPSKSIELIEIVKIINSISKYHSEIIVRNKGMNFEYTGDNSRLIQHMGTDFEFTSYEIGIEKMYRYYLENIDKINVMAVKEDKLINYCSIKKDISSFV